MSTIRKFDISTVVEITDPATNEERLTDTEPIDPLVVAMAVSEAQRVLASWTKGDRQYISVHVLEVP